MFIYVLAKKQGRKGKGKLQPEYVYSISVPSPRKLFHRMRKYIMEQHLPLTICRRYNLFILLFVLLEN
jgi:hypothetical protein